jgi:hypothetical protein
MYEYVLLGSLGEFRRYIEAYCFEQAERIAGPIPRTWWIQRADVWRRLPPEDVFDMTTVQLPG